MKSKIRLHKYIHELVTNSGKDYTRPEIQRNIQQYGVMINSKLSTNRLEWVTIYDVIHIEHWPQRTHGDLSAITLVQENDNFLLFYKPAGVVIESGAGHTHDTFLHWLIAHHPNQSTLNPDFRYGLVHRLDKDTEGLVLIAKSDKSYIFYKSLFKNRHIIKKYLTILTGQVISQQTITTYNVRDNEHPTRQKAFLDQKSAERYSPHYRKAQSLFTPLIYSPTLHQTLVEVTLITGRMHQIRLHAETIAHPLIGDTKYSITHRNYDIGKPQSTAQNQSTTSNTHLPKTAIPQSTAQEFTEIINNIFQPQSFYLLANYLEFSDLDNTHYTIEYKPIQQLLTRFIKPI